MVAVAICICTYKRPNALRRLLEKLSTIDHAGSASVIVVDNSVDGEGEKVCKALLEDGYRWTLSYAIELEPGISFARNRALQIAMTASPDFIAMLDDDEWPEPQWLKELLRVQRSTGADIVGGPVIPVFPPGAEQWQDLAPYYGADRPLADESTCLLYASGNFMASLRSLVALMPTPFDERFAKSGGEDMHLFRRLAELGFSMRWAAHARVLEEVPESRMNLAWLRQRQIRRGNLNVLIQRVFEPGWRAEVLRIAKTCGLLGISITLLVFAFPYRPWRIRSHLLLYKAFGKILGHFGQRHYEYRVVHGA